MSMRDIQKVLCGRGVEGIILPPHLGTPDWSGFHWDRFSVVRLGRTVQTPAAHIVTSDQVANAMLAFKMIGKRGYERIAYVTGDGWQRGTLFTAGVLMAQYTRDRGLQLPVFELDERNAEASRLQFTEWLKKVRPDAILTDMALVSDMLKKAGYRIPEDIGLAAMSVLDGNAVAGIDEKSEEIGRVATLVVVSLINDHALGVPPIERQILIKGSWVDGSTLPPRAKPGSCPKQTAQRRKPDRAVVIAK